MAEKASSSRPTPAKPAKSGSELTPLSTVSSVMRSDRRFSSTVRIWPETGSSGGRETASPLSATSRRTVPYVASASGFSVCVVEIVALNSGASTAPTWTRALRLSLVIS